MKGKWAMHQCINCNSKEVARDGDTFTCARCGYTWDVAHEQANAAYLASQGREPAKTLEEVQAASALDAALGLDQPVEPSAQDRLVAALVKHNVPDIESLAEEAGVDLADARLKDEKIAALVTSGKVALDEHGDVVVQATKVAED
jgi:uncharacterized Zn finger protein (UPF0148 family)